MDANHSMNQAQIHGGDIHDYSEDHVHASNRVVSTVDHDDIVPLVTGPSMDDDRNRSSIESSHLIPQQLHQEQSCSGIHQTNLLVSHPNSCSTPKDLQLSGLQTADQLELPLKPMLRQIQSYT